MKYISTLVTQGSGVIGNIVAEKNGVLRIRNIPANPNTAAQSSIRAALTAAAIAWRDTLSTVNQDGWNAYATTVSRKDALGKDIKLTGIDMYVAAACADILAGNGPFGTAPTTPGALLLPAVTGVVADDSANTVIFTFADDIPVNVNVNISFSTSPVSPGVRKFNGPYRLTQSVAGSAGPTITATGFTGVATEVLGWKVSAIDQEGRVSRAQSGLTTIVA